MTRAVPIPASDDAPHNVRTVAVQNKSWAVNSDNPGIVISGLERPPMDGIIISSFYNSLKNIQLKGDWDRIGIGLGFWLRLRLKRTVYIGQ